MKNRGCDTLGGVLNGNSCMILGHVGMLNLNSFLKESKHQNSIAKT